MSRYIEFLFPECQEYKFIDFLDSVGAAIISATSGTPSPELIKRFHKKGENIFWNKAYIIRKGDIFNIDMTLVKSCGHYVIEDIYKAPVIEFRRSKERALENAWIHASFYYCEDQQKKYKGEEFESLYKNIETWINNNCDVVKPNCRLYGVYCDY